MIKYLYYAIESWDVKRQSIHTAHGGDNGGDELDAGPRANIRSSIHCEATPELLPERFVLERLHKIGSDLFDKGTKEILEVLQCRFSRPFVSEPVVGSDLLLPFFQENTLQRSLLFSQS